MKTLLKTLVVLLLMLQINQSQADTTKVESYLKSKEFQDQLYEVGLYWDTNILGIQQSCAGEYILQLMRVDYIKPLEFYNSSLYPTSGVWTSRFSFTRCDETIIYNVIAVAQPTGKPEISALIPGTSGSSYSLLMDLYTQALPIFISTKSKDKDCNQSPNVLDSKISMNPTTTAGEGTTHEGVWEEVWLVQHCAEEIEVTFCLIPDMNGGTSWSLGQCLG